jgi:hypothetical protein
MDVCQLPLEAPKVEEEKEPHKMMERVKPRFPIRNVS